MAPKAWQCSQCGTVNEPGTRACRECGKWPSLFDLQDGAVEEAEPEVVRPEVFEPETFEPEVFQPEAAGDDGEEERRGRFPRWVVTAIWITGLAVWIVVNALADRG
jgi:predicted ATP-dependent serine protease